MHKIARYLISCSFCHAFFIFDWRK